MGELAFTGQLTSTACWCGVAVAIPDSLYREARHNGHTVYCPLGHTFGWSKTRVKQLEEKLAASEREAARQRELRATAERQAELARKKLRRAEARCDRGVCTECNRTFANVARHMKSKHGVT